MSNSVTPMPPVVFIVFNRLDATRQVLQRIREQRPKTLFVISDGARPNKPGEDEKVRAVRQLIKDTIDWDCDLRCDFSPTNLGCRQRIASGLNWVFEHVEEAIILEDDCLPDPTFFSFCATLLDTYKDDPRVVHIGGANVIAEHTKSEASYWFTRHAWIWGWATWKRAWKQYDFEMQSWGQRYDAMAATFASGWEAGYWISTWDQIRHDLGKANTWGFPWMYSCRSGGGLSILPTNNLIRNIGFGPDSTHTAEELHHLKMDTQGYSTMRHPTDMKVDRYRDELLSRTYAGHSITALSNLKSRVRVALSGRS